MMEGYLSIEEQVQDYIEFFHLLQKGERDEIEQSFPVRKEMIAGREELSQIFLPAVCLRERCALTETEYWLVMFAFCLEVEGGLCLDCREKQGMPPDFQYALHLLSKVLPVDFELIAGIYRQESVLGELLELSSREGTGCLMQPLLLNSVAFLFLLNGELPREEWYRLFPAGEAELSLEQTALPLHRKEYDRLRRYFDMEKPPRVLLQGVRGSGKHMLLQRVCREIRQNLVFVRVSKILRESERRRESQSGEQGVLRKLCLICRLLDPVLVLDVGTEENAAAGQQSHWLVESILSGNAAGCRTVLLAESRGEARELWKYADIRLFLEETLSAEETKSALDVWIAPEERRNWQEELLNRYRLNIGELVKKLRSVRLEAEHERLTLADRFPWETGLAEQDIDSGLGRLIESRYTLEEIVLPEDCREQLATVVRLAKGWSGEQGLHLLFHGSSGTGKTMAASALAGELGIPLFRVDLSQVFDKYIGETEKHLDEIFRVARRGRCLLFFDEADALFGKRTDIQDSHDKYANVSTAYLLQRIEDYDGIVILTTNLLDHFDDAFVRRIRFVIRFRNLDREGRQLMWSKTLEGMTQTAEDISPEALAQAAELSPARIKAAAQVARILAKSEGGGTVTKEHLRKALELEAGKDETALRKF